MKIKKPYTLAFALLSFVLMIAGYDAEAFFFLVGAVITLALED